MRISTGMIYSSGLDSMQNRTSSLLRTQQQLSTGRRMLSPADDPVAAARALEVSQSMQLNANQATARDNAKSIMGISDGQLESATNLMTRIRELTVQGGNAALTDNDRKSIATELRARFQELVALANSRDGNGLYLFGGYQTNNQPFAGSVENGVAYAGDDGVRTLRVSGAREVPVSNSGNDVFMRIKNGNGVFATGAQSAKSANATQIAYEGYSALTNPATDTGSFELRFWTDTAGTVKVKQALGTVDVSALAYPATFADATHNAIDITLGGTTVTVDLDPAGVAGGTRYASANDIAAAIQTALQDAVGASVTVSVDSAGKLVVNHAGEGGAGTLTIADAGGGGIDSAAALFGVPVVTDDVAGPAGATYFDLVDANGESLFADITSAAGGTANTYTRRYESGKPLNLVNVETPVFDYDAQLLFTGTPADGDTFTIDRTASSLSVTAKTLNASAARATIDAGSVSDPKLWSQTANSGELEVRFWVDVQGTIATAGQAIGTSTIPPGLTINAANNQFNININGTGAVAVTVASATYATPADLADAVQTGVDAALGAAPPAAGSATVSLDSANRLVITLTDTGSASNLAITAVGGDSGFDDLFGGSVTATAGLAAGAGRTYYDLVDATTGNSLFTGGTSTAGGAGNTFTHAYTSGSAISLASAGGGAGADPAFDFGATVTVSGVPANGDTFTIDAGDAYYGNGYFVTAAKSAAALNAGGGIIGAGEVLDAQMWNHPANSRNLEVRFWRDESATPPVLYYDLVDVETEKSLFSNTTSTAGGSGNTYTHAFVDGDSISFSGLNVPYGAETIDDFGIAVTIDGTPATGDVFKVQASQSQSVFETLGRLITSLEAGMPPGTSGNTHLANELAGVLSNLGQIEDNFLRVRASIGTRLAEIEDLDSLGQDLNLRYEETLSQLQDLDYAAAITQLTRNQMELQAAQQSFVKISQLSLFNYL